MLSGITKSEVESIIKLHPAMFFEIFHRRSVNNIYFDSHGLNNYFDNINGDLHRRKTRIRWYGELFSEIVEPVLELKIKNGLLGKKLHYPLPPFKLDNHFNMRDIFYIVQKAKIPELIKTEIKLSQPVLLNRYSRKYFQSADKRYRITIDTDQIFYRISAQNNFFLNNQKDVESVILELKYDVDADNDASYITEHFPFRLTKSSKYISDLEKIYVK